MTKYIITTFILLISICSAQNTSPAPNEASFRGQDYAFSVSIPKGWILDTSTRAMVSGSMAVLYTDDGKILPGGIKIDIATKNLEGNETLMNLVRYFAKLGSNSNPPIKHFDGPSLTTKDKRSVLVRCTQGDISTTTAYIDNKNFVVLIMMWRETDEQYQKALPAFKEVVESYHTIEIK